MSTTGTHAEADAAAVEIAERFGETSERPRAQLRRMARLMGAAWMRETAHVAVPEELCYLKDRTRRTLGGIFFVVARERAKVLVDEGALTRRQFFRCFFDRPKKPRPPAPPAPKREKRPRPPPAPRRTHERRAPAGKHYPQAEVYTIRRRG